MRRRGRGGAGGAAALALLFATAVAPGRLPAQLSPGPLSRPHAALEGSSRCGDCHTPGTGVDAAACLACHEALADRRERGRGLHARPGMEDCQRCHVEHQGRDFELVWWGERGREAFDHATAGFPLAGRHAEIGCRDCHQPALVRDRSLFADDSVDPRRTFLGLGTTCGDCHVDVHGGQFGELSCTDCHGQDAWRPASGFDHQATAFPLRGRHLEAACGACHRPHATAAGAPRTFRGVAAECAACHRDPHEGRLGASCADCHGAESWRQVSRSAFDHERTRFPLRGAHAPVACRHCHDGPQPWRQAGFDRCATCHRDPHLGQLAEGGRRDCAACHEVATFRRSSFGIAEHQESSYPLVGAHLAVACNACHRPVAAAQVAPRAGGRRGGALVTRFHFSDTDCVACHADPHEGRLDRFAGEEGCLSCHRLDGWQLVAFDHSRSAFPLTGRHAEAACATCHRAGELPLPVAPAAAPAGPLRLAGLPLACEGCHADPHAGQLATGGGTDCARCHSTRGWREVDFDHAVTRFPLDGAHARVPCAGCHPRRDEGGRDAVVFRPLPTTCAGCHREVPAG